MNIWNTIVDFLTHVSFGSILTYMGTGAGLFFGIDRWLLSHRKPKARLRFADGKNWKLLRKQLNDFIALPVEDIIENEQNPL